MQPDEYFEREYQSRVNTPAARYADGQYTVDACASTRKPCPECGTIGAFSGNHRICNRCRGRRARR